MLEIMEINMAPKKADQNPEIVILVLKRSVMSSIAVFTTNKENPKERKASGKVSIFKTVPKVALIKAKTRATIK